ncbi:MAG: cytochrome c-type biogenesis protein CcmH [Anaerolineales bacterium]|nr:cytochrome c-type biogenesis protein CcmH [Anaerolineales bacterium]
MKDRGRRTKKAPASCRLPIAQYFAFALVLAALTGFFVAQSARAQETTPSDDEVNAIAKHLYCPVCENTPLDVCPTEACRQWRELIRQMLAEGKSEQEIKDYFVANYGARVLAEPPRAGVNWLFYLVPPILILGGAFALFSAFRAWMKPKVAESDSGREAAGASSSDDEYVRRIEEELKKRK